MHFHKQLRFVMNWLRKINIIQNTAIFYLIKKNLIGNNANYGFTKHESVQIFEDNTENHSSGKAFT